MRSRYPSSSTLAYSFGPGPLTPAIKAIVVANVAAFLVSLVVPAITLTFGLRPADIFGRLHIWRPVTYMFLHAGITHILFNMLALWMFGVELERMWGSRYFLKYYFVCGIGAALDDDAAVVRAGFFRRAAVLLADDRRVRRRLWRAARLRDVLSESRPIYMYFVFPIPAKYFVAIIGAISLLSSMSGPGGGIAHTTHLGGLVAGYLYLKGGRIHLLSEIKYRYLKWRINRMRRKFDVYSGGRSADDVNRRVH